MTTISNHFHTTTYGVLLKYFSYQKERVIKKKKKKQMQLVPLTPSGKLVITKWSACTVSESGIKHWIIWVYIDYWMCINTRLLDVHQHMNIASTSCSPYNQCNAQTGIAWQKEREKQTHQPPTVWNKQTLKRDQHVQQRRRFGHAPIFILETARLSI